MSTTINEVTFLRVPEERVDEANESVLSRFVARGSANDFGVRSDRMMSYLPFTEKRQRDQSRQNIRVIRRLSGYLMEMQAKIARVMFVDKGENFEYEMPSANLRNVGVEMVNQPFEMDEIEIQMPDSFVVGYRFRALASKADAFVETADFNEEYQQKRDLIFKGFAKNKA